MGLLLVAVAWLLLGTSLLAIMGRDPLLLAAYGVLLAAADTLLRYSAVTAKWCEAVGSGVSGP